MERGEVEIPPDLKNAEVHASSVPFYCKNNAKLRLKLCTRRRLTSQGKVCKDGGSPSLAQKVERNETHGRVVLHAQIHSNVRREEVYDMTVATQHARINPSGL